MERMSLVRLVLISITLLLTLEDTSSARADTASDIAKTDTENLYDIRGNLNDRIPTDSTNVDAASLERLAENLGLVNDDGVPFALTSEEATQLESQIAAIQHQAEIRDDNPNGGERSALEYVTIKVLHSLISRIWNKFGPAGDRSEQGVCENTPCRQNSSLPYCSPLDGFCVECLSDQTCVNPSFPFCKENDCKQCLGQSDCQNNRAKQVCSPETQNCLECLEDSDCKDKDRKKCDTETSTCVQCLEKSDCDTLYPCSVPGACLDDRFCSENNECVSCTIDDHCRFCPPTPVCGPLSVLSNDQIAGRRQKIGGVRSLTQVDENSNIIPTACLQCKEDPDCDKLNGTRNFCEEGLCSQCRNDTICPAESPFCVDGNCKKCPDGSDACPGDQERSCQSSIDCPDDLVPFCGGSLNNSCVECTTNDHCNPPNPVCSTNNTCTQCSIDGDCGPPNSYCVSGRCSGCRTDADCRSPLPKCSLSDATCVQCLSSDDCSSPFPECEALSRTCVEVCFCFLWCWVCHYLLTSIYVRIWSSVFYTFTPFHTIFYVVLG